MAENNYYSSLSGDEIESRLVGAVVFNATQGLTTSEKARARQNIGAGASDTKVIIMGYFDTLEELESRYPVGNLGDAYGVGTQSPYAIYIWDNVHSVWVNNGPIVLSDAVIDDEDISSDTAWSSSKTNTEIGAVRTFANAAQSAANAAQQTANRKAPTSHASTATTYGVGNASKYGHVKLSNSPNASQGTGNGVAATPAAVQSAINAGKWKLLWTNPNPTSAFAEQAISLDLSEYQEVLIKLPVWANNSDQQCMCEQGLVGSRIWPTYWQNDIPDGNAILTTRRMEVSASGVNVFPCYSKNGSSAASTTNNLLVPRYIYAR